MADVAVQRNIVETVYRFTDRATGPMRSVAASMLSLRNIAHSTMGAFATGALLYGMGRVTRAAMEASAFSEQSRTAITETLVAYGKVGEEIERINRGAQAPADWARTVTENLRMAQSVSRSVMDEITLRSAQLPGTAQEFAEVFRIALPAAIDAGMTNIHEIAALTSNVMGFAATRQISASVAGQNLARMLRGQATQIMKLWTNLGTQTGLAAKAFNHLTAPERLAAINRAMARQMPTLNALAGTWEAIRGTAESMALILGRDAFEPMFERMKSSLSDINTLLWGNRDAIVAFGRALSERGANTIARMAISAKQMAISMSSFVHSPAFHALDARAGQAWGGARHAVGAVLHSGSALHRLGLMTLQERFAPGIGSAVGRGVGRLQSSGGAVRMGLYEALERGATFPSWVNPAGIQRVVAARAPRAGLGVLAEAGSRLGSVEAMAHAAPRMLRFGNVGGMVGRLAGTLGSLIGGFIQFLTHTNAVKAVFMALVVAVQGAWTLFKLVSDALSKFDTVVGNILAAVLPPFATVLTLVVTTLFTFLGAVASVAGWIFEAVSPALVWLADMVGKVAILLAGPLTMALIVVASYLMLQFLGSLIATVIAWSPFIIAGALVVAAVYVVASVLTWLANKIRGLFGMASTGTLDQNISTIAHGFEMPGAGSHGPMADFLRSARAVPGQVEEFRLQLGRERASADRSTPHGRGGTYNDFRNSRFDITQRFAEGFDPDRMALAFTSDLERQATQRLQSGFAPLWTVPGGG